MNEIGTTEETIIHYSILILRGVMAYVRIQNHYDEKLGDPHLALINSVELEKAVFYQFRTNAYSNITNLDILSVPDTATHASASSLLSYIRDK